MGFSISYIHQTSHKCVQIYLLEKLFVPNKFVAVKVLALEAQVLRHLPLRYAEFAFRFAPGAELPAPDGLAVRVRHPLRQAVEFGVVPVNFTVVENAVDARQRLVAAFGVNVLNVVVRLAVALFTGEL